jgi:hypothetical protein
MALFPFKPFPRKIASFLSTVGGRVETFLALYKALLHFVRGFLAVFNGLLHPGRARLVARHHVDTFLQKKSGKVLTRLVCSGLAL